MAILEDFLQAFDASELKELENRLQKRNGVGLRRDAEVLKLLADSQGKAPREIALDLYGEENLNAYHSLRKRLMQSAQEYVFSRSIDGKEDKKERIVMLLKSARFLIVRGKHDTALKMLQKAKRTAMNNDFYAELLNVLTMEVEFADELGLDHQRLVKDWQKAEGLADIQQRTDLAYALLKIRLREARTTGNMDGVDTMVRTQLEDLGIDLDQDLPVAVVLKMLSIIRMAIIASKGYYQFDPLVERAFEKLRDQGKLDKRDAEVYAGFLYMLAHTKYRTRQLKAAWFYLTELDECLEQAPLKIRQRYLGRLLLLKGCVMMFQGRSKEARKLLLLAEMNEGVKISDTLNISMNRAMFYILTNEVKKANQVMHDIALTDRECERHMGKEWRFKKNMIEFIIQWEMGNTEIALNRIRYIQSHFAPLFATPLYKRAGAFTAFVRKFAERPDEVRTEFFLNSLNSDVERLPTNMEDLQAITFYTWLTAKIFGKDYYDHLVDTVQNMGKNRRKYH